MEKIKGFRREISRGVTLIEVTLAMFLGSFLLLALFQSFYLSARYRMLSGDAQTFGLSLTNCIRDLSSDLTGHAPPKPKYNFKQEPKSSQLARMSAVRSMLGFQDSFAVGPRTEWVSFVGKPNYCAFQTAASHPRFNHLPSDAIHAGNSLVIWWVYDGTTPRVEGWRTNDLSVAKEVQVPIHAKGLIRTQVFLDAKGDEKQLSEVINPDVTAIQFRYANGSSIEPLWDNAQIQPSPIAVEAQLTIMNHLVSRWISIPSARTPLNSSLSSPGISYSPLPPVLRGEGSGVRGQGANNLRFRINLPALVCKAM